MNPNDIKSQLSVFNESCLSFFRDSMEREYKVMCRKMEDNLQKSIMTMVGKDIYDYSHVPEARFELGEYFQKRVQNMDNRNNCDQFRINYHNFLTKRVEGEKIILLERCFNSSVTYFIALTNFSRLCVLGFRNDDNNVNVFYKEFDFWMPQDYMHVIKMMLNNILHCNDSIFTNIFQLLQHLKTNLENGKYVKNNVDIKFMEVYAREQQSIKLKAQIDHEKRNHDLNLKTQYRMLNIEKNRIKQQKENLRLVARKIKIEKMKLVQQKEEFDRRMLTHVDDTKILDDIDAKFNNKAESEIICWKCKKNCLL